MSARRKWAGLGVLLLFVLSCGGGGQPGDAGDAPDPANEADAPSCACVEDAFEPNESCAVPAPGGSLSTTTTNRLGLCGGEDWFDMRLSAGQTMTVTLTHDPTCGDIDLQIIDGGNGCVLVTESAQAGTTTESVTTTGPASGMAFRCIRVFPHAGTVQNNYTLDVNIR